MTVQRAGRDQDRGRRSMRDRRGGGAALREAPATEAPVALDVTSGPSRTPAGLVRAHPTVAFFVVAYALSWAYWLVVLGILGRHTLAWFVPGAFGPPVAALLVTAVAEGRAGLRPFLQRWVLWRVHPRWYVVALVGLPVLAVLVALPFRDGTQRFAGPGSSVVVSYLAALSFLAVLGGGQEEPGWRGFALPRLQRRMGPLAASVLLGVLWGLWHLPVFVLVPDYNAAGSGWASIAVMVLVFTAAGAVGQSLLLTWLFNHTRASVLVAVLAHASLNAGSGFVATSRSASMVVLVTWGVAGVVVAWATRGRLGCPPEP